MYLRSLLFLVLLFVSSCSGQKVNITLIELNSTGMFFQSVGNMTTIESTAKVAFMGNLELYIGRVKHLNLENIKDGGGKIIDEKVKSIDTSYVAYVRRQNQIQGIEYALGTDNRIKGNGKVIKADSLWSTLSFYNYDPKNMELDIGKPVEVVKRGKRKVEKYALSPEVGQVDSIYRFYDQSLKRVPFSFSRKLDTLNNSKLYKIFAVANEIPKGVALPNAAIPRREFNYKMKILKEDYQIYLDIFHHFTEDSKRLHLK